MAADGQFGGNFRREALRPELRALAPRGEDLLAEVKLGLDEELYPVIRDAHERSEGRRSHEAPPRRRAAHGPTR